MELNPVGGWSQVVLSMTQDWGQFYLISLSMMGKLLQGKCMQAASYH